MILFTIIALGGFLRAWQIDSVPPGIYPDEDYKLFRFIVTRHH